MLKLTFGHLHGSRALSHLASWHLETNAQMFFHTDQTSFWQYVVYCENTYVGL